ncbi:laminin subunit alpha lam-3 isoform X1 [Euwallacea similis]|uniref:laminin subunit alpha lam-3 isoform X1 n=1 Tax=Euwallacea similis TaxID=1736056 RepID=UPI003450927F
MGFKKQHQCVVLVFVALVCLASCAKRTNKGGIKYDLKFLKNHRGIGSFRRNINSSNVGLWPSVFNLATKAVISANATCGARAREEFCKLSNESSKGRCGICDDYSTDPTKRHPINLAIDGSNRWWQSPALLYGPEFEFVTVTVDLKQIYQIGYIILKAGNSPRPGCWVLERSLDGEHFEPWQYFASTEKECLDRFGIAATSKGKPRYFTDTDVICTTFFSKLMPLENGEVHVSLIQGRPGAEETSPELLEFTKARYVRFKFLGLRGNLEPVPSWLGQDRNKWKKLFYSIKDIAIGGQCVCNGHAENCRHNVASGHPECECQHHTCGPNCEKCCPLFNQRQWYPGSSRDAQQCVPCNCHGHAQSCRYEEEVDRAALSLGVNGTYQGGGVCENCADFTTGINCEKCLTGFFRPPGALPQDPRPCIKCECSVVGATEDICIQYGPSAGTCKCKSGYSGSKCDSCASGFRGYPNCESCPCDLKGVIPGNDCEEQCFCKANVEGEYCDRCKPGHFGLSLDHPDGCLPCFCSEVTSVCELALVKSKTIQTLENWLITDLKVSNFITPVTSPTSVFSVGNYELPGVENLYWLAPKDYLGNKLEMYGSTLTFNVQWVVMRGDTSGEPTVGPDIIIVGSNRVQLGYGDNIYSSQKMTFDIEFSEKGWYVIPSEIRDITTRMLKSDYNNGPVSRELFLSVIADLKYMLLRGTFHTDQIEALLENAIMSYGSEDSNYEKGSVEKCSCPSGYSGLSCENCSFGYVRISSNTSSIKDKSFCGKCDCNGHSETCNAATGECFCEHNTIGEKCERCGAGYYGNPLRGTPDDCKKCACPLENPENNFSPGCQLDYFNLNNEGGYVCTQCPNPGYTGDHCEICDDGYFGDPTEVGNSCQVCDCNGGPCDRKTGQCLACKGNTEGWKCDRCKPDHYGEAASSNCKACECDLIGSENRQCDNGTGQCLCKEKFVGRTCDRCEAGFGNVSALCPPCSCDSIGSKSGLCDPHTGICDCLPGVDGFRCDTCQNLHWGFSAIGCQACNCDPHGSKYSSCDPVNGNCICKTHHEGRTCDVCKAGYWKTLKKDCIKCHCNEYGATDSFCNQETGQCNCKPGVTGQNCDQCLLNFYGTVETGCIECEPCMKSSHICGKGGKCICPPLTIGLECELCALNSWGYQPRIGCKNCNCSHTGSSNLQCEKNSGICSCKVGYKGSKCDRCSFGYHGYPNCRKCMCNAIGTLETECQNGDCQCNENGSCNCKENVIGSKCNKCKEGTFGLSKEHSKGCEECFCFGRSDTCSDTRFNWDKIRFEKGIESNEPISFDTISLPGRFMGDLTTSYGGYLSVNGSGGKFSVFLTGNGISLKSDLSTHELRLNEKFWKVTSGNLPGCQSFLTRECFLLVLQKVTSIIIQGEDMEIVEVLLDSAKPYIPYNRTSHSIEQCECPLEYAGLSCQNPNNGYYRYYPTEEEEVTATSWIDQVIGVATSCNCNLRSWECDPDSGHCKNCLNNTSGFHCELCDTGYYLDYRGNCQACLCPSELDNNAESCVAKKNSFVCHCKLGYTGSKCEHCKDSYYRDPITNKCIPCDCNYYGSYSSICNPFGVCQCRPGFQGDKCNQCRNSREYIKEGVCTACDECTQILFNDIERLYKSLDVVTDLFKDGLSPPWKVLDALKARNKQLSKSFTYKLEKANNVLKFEDLNELEMRVNDMKEKVKLLNKRSDEDLKQMQRNRDLTENFQGQLKQIKEKIMGLIKRLKEFGEKHIDAEEAVKQAEAILNAIDTNVQKQIDDVEIYNKPIENYCKKISEKVNDLYHDPPNLPCNDLNEFIAKLDDLEAISKETREKTSIASSQNDQNRLAILKLKGDLMDFNEIKSEVLKSIDDINGKIKEINGKMSALTNVIETMKNFDFNDWDKLENRVYNLEEETPLLEDLVHRASEHAQRLKKIVVDRIGALNFTKNETEKIKESTAYSDIMEGIASARETANKAREILKKALEIMHPNGGDTLIDKANLAHSRSDRLKHRINNMKNISNNLNSRRKEVDNLRAELIDNARYNNELYRQLQSIETQLTSKDPLINKLHEAIDNNTGVIDRMRQIEKEVANLNIPNNLFNDKNKYDEAKTETERAIRKADQDVKDAIRNVDRLLESGQGFDGDKVANAQEKLDKVTSKIADLQNKIKYAKQVVETVNVAIGLSNCSMAYTSPLPQIEAFRSLSITFKGVNCQLFKWDRGGLSIRIRNARAILSYTIDSLSGTLTTSKQRDIASEKTLYVEKVGSLLRLKYNNDTHWNSTHLGTRSLTIDPTDVFEIGDGHILKENTTYINKLSINDYNIGLWKFSQTSGNCTGQQRTNVTESDTTKPFYSGNGYKKYGPSDLLAPLMFNLEFQISTFDENSLIYFAHEIEHPSAIIALTLDQGHLRLDVIHNNGKAISLKTDKKLNDGRPHQVGIAMVFSNDKQMYTLEADTANNGTNAILGKKFVFRIRKAVHYVGGISPTLDLNNITVSTRSFLGFLVPPALPNEQISSGVTQKPGELKLHKAWFGGTGSLHLRFPLPPKKSAENNISFILRPLNASAALLDIRNIGTITLTNWLLQVNLVNGEHYVVDKRLALNVNDYNRISITFKKDLITFKINDEELDVSRTKTERMFEEDYVDVVLGRHEGFHSFCGGFSELNVNHEDILFTPQTVVNFSNVEIGREEPFVRPMLRLERLRPGPPVTQIAITNTMQSTQGCAATANYETDPTAVNFGDQAESYIKLKTGFFKKDFTLEFEFRTLYPNGMLFITMGATSTPQYNLLELKNGLVIFHVKARKNKLPKKNWPQTFLAKVNDGKWHKLTLMKKNKMLQMWLDGEAKKPVKLPKTNVKNEIFFGNVPKDYISSRELKQRINPFRGCMNNLKINEQLTLLGKNTSDVSYSNIRQCFPNIEEGAYFSGDSYAIYKEGFRIHKILDLSFEFRTAEQNGILLTVSNEGNYPALSVELQNGAVVMTVDLGNGVQTNVTNNLDSDFSLCNNLWHNVSAMYSSSELTVNVDGIRKSWVKNDINSLMDEIDAPLYIGGLPDNAAVGTLKTRENFKGCLRNLKIERELKDWAEMEELNGVLVNSCPTTSTPKS